MTNLLTIMQDAQAHLNQATEALRQEWTSLAPYALPLENVKDRSAVFVREVKDSEGSTTQAYVKIYANQKHPLQRFLRKSRSQTEVRNLLFFRSIGISTPRILAWGEHRNALGRIIKDFIITEAIPDSLQLDEFVPTHCPDRSRPEYCSLRNQIIKQLGQWTAAMHAHGFIHEDLKWRNILARSTNQAVELYWIDCPKGSFRKGSGLARKKLKDCATLDKIARIDCDKKERRNFLCAYLDSPSNSPEVAQMCDQIEEYRKRRFDVKDDQQRNITC
ncbi:lipopolysaccharide kinase InaA family protein [Coraliomargarita sp. W4R53]